MSLRRRKKEIKEMLAVKHTARDRCLRAVINLAMTNTRSTKVPKGWEEFYTALAGVTDRFCAEHLNDEYADLARSAIAALCRKRPICWPAEINKPGDAPSFTRWGKSTS